MASLPDSPRLEVQLETRAIALVFPLPRPGYSRTQRRRNTGRRTERISIIGHMGTVRITEAELARDVHAVLVKVQEGFEVVIVQNHCPIAVIRPFKPTGRMISEVLADLKARGSTAVMDDDFARDIEEGIKAQRQPWNPPSWD